MAHEIEFQNSIQVVNKCLEFPLAYKKTCIQDGPFLGCSQIGGAKGPPYPTSVTHVPQ